MSPAVRGADRPGQHEILIGILLMVGATQLQPVMDATAKYLGGQISPLQVAWGRMLFQMLFTLPLVVAASGVAGLLPRPLGLQVLRGVLLAGANATFFFAIAAMPLADAIALVFVAPLIVTAMSALLLGEAVGRTRWLAVAVGLAGAIIVIRPGTGVFGPVGLLPLGTAVFYASYLIVTRRLTGAARPMQTHFFTALTSTVVLSLPLAAGMVLDIPSMSLAPADAVQWALLALVGLLSTVAHLLIIFAYGRAPASVLAPISYLEIIGASLIGYVVFGDFPDGWTWLGVVIIVASGLYIVLSERAGTPVSARMHGKRAKRP